MNESIKSGANTNGAKEKSKGVYHLNCSYKKGDYIFETKNIEDFPKVLTALAQSDDMELLIKKLEPLCVIYKIEDIRA